MRFFDIIVSMKTTKNSSEAKQNIPQHIGIILDGNRRWARKRNLPTFQGHKKGFDNLKNIATYAFDVGVKTLTVYAFSTENWNRSKEEVDYLMKLFKSLVNKEAEYLAKKGIKMNILGKVEDFDGELQKGIKNAIKITADGKKGTLNICMNYGGREEITHAFQKIIAAKIDPKDVNKDLISRYLYTAGQTDPDLIIRTSGEQRLSGFLTWQSIYSEFYFPKKDWPEFEEKDLDEAIEIYSNRKRRFGGN